MRLSMAALLTALTASAFAAPLTGNLLLTLDGAVGRPDKSTAPLKLQIPVREGQFTTCWGEAAINRAASEGTITRGTIDGNTLTLDVAMEIGSDPWVKGGRGAYQLQLTLNGSEVTGTFTGKYNGLDRTVSDPPRRALGTPLVPKKTDFPVLFTADVAGKVAGTLGTAWPAAVPGFVPLQPQEHPRLIFRKSDLAQMRQHAETPGGKAIMARFWAVIDKDAGGGANKFGAWQAVGYGFAYQMTGDAKYAAQAKAIVDEEFFQKPAAGGQDIHHAPRAQGLALAFDLCYDGWDADFRAKCVGELQQRVQELATARFEGGGMGGANLAPWSNHNGIRASGMGLAALAIIGEKNVQGQVMEDAERYADMAAREVKIYLTEGVGGAGYGMEGMFYKGMTLRRGVFSMMYAYRTALGKDLTPSPMSDGLVIGPFMEGQPGSLLPVARDYDGIGADYLVDGDDLHDIYWAQGGVSVPPALLPGYKWLLDHNVGLQGTKTFGMVAGYYAPYIMASYPFDVQAAPPAENFPWVMPDPRLGHYVFRPAIKDAQDILVTTNLLTDSRSSCHNERVGVPMELVVQGFGRPWIAGACLPTTAEAKARNAYYGAEITGQRLGSERTCVLNMSLDRAYLEQAGRVVPAGTKLVRWTNSVGSFIDRGIRGTRSMAVDCSGKSGAPLLIAIVDRITQADGKPAPGAWTLPVAAQAGTVTVNGNRFTVGDANGPSLTGIIPTATALAPGAVTALDGGTYFVVFTLQNGPAPAITVEGTGLQARVKVGGRTVRYDGETVVLE